MWQGPYPEVPIGKGTTKSAAGWGRAARAGGEGDPEGKIAPGDAPGEGKRRIPKPNEKGGREVETRKVGRAGLQVDPEFSHVTPSLLSAKQDELLSNVACFASTLLCSHPRPCTEGSNSLGIVLDEIAERFENFVIIEKSMDVGDAPGEGKRRAPLPQEAGPYTPVPTPVLTPVPTPVPTLLAAQLELLLPLPLFCVCVYSTKECKP